MQVIFTFCLWLAKDLRCIPQRAVFRYVPSQNVLKVLDRDISERCMKACS
jgi:hypothetical protein